MSNLFIVNTPLQLLTAYIIANGLKNKEHNHLMLINSMHNELLNSCYYVRKILEDSIVWQQVSLREHWLGRNTRLLDIKKEMRNMKDALFEQVVTIDNVFLGSDKVIQNQILVELSGKSNYIRLEDGVWSYSCKDRHWLSKVWQSQRIMLLRLLGNLKSDMQYNLGGLGHGKAALADYLYKPDLLERSSPQAVAIERDLVLRSLDRLPEIALSGYPDAVLEDGILFLGSLQVEYGHVTEDSELRILTSILDMCKKSGLKLVYKPHPAESKDKLSRYQELLPGITYCKIKDPIEILYNKLETIKCVMAHSSSGLIFADIFSKNQIKSIALFKLYGAQDNSLHDMMIKANVIIPNNLEQLTIELDKCKIN